MQDSSDTATSPWLGSSKQELSKKLRANSTFLRALRKENCTGAEVQLKWEHWIKATQVVTFKINKYIQTVITTWQRLRAGAATPNPPHATRVSKQEVLPMSPEAFTAPQNDAASASSYFCWCKHKAVADLLCHFCVKNIELKNCKLSR